MTFVKLIPNSVPSRTGSCRLAAESNVNLHGNMKTAAAAVSWLLTAVCGLLQNCSILLDLMFVTLHCYWSLGCGVRWILTRMVQSGLNKLHEFAPHI